MRRRQGYPEEFPRKLDALVTAMLSMRTPEELRDFLEDLCTPAELQALVGRWEAVPLILDEVPYREIHDRTGVSVTTVGRVARCVDSGSGGYRTAARRLGYIEDDER